MAANAMLKLKHWRRAAFAMFTGCAIVALSFGTQVGLGALTPAAAQLSLEFRYALSPYGVWRHHPRFGDVWVPRHVPHGWRPYEYGHWVFTEEWGWYWVSDEDEADWGWVVFHYGRWVYEPGWGWLWVPGDEWAPAWVDWCYGDDYVGWAPLPPDALLDVYEDQPVYWVFVQPRYIIAPHPRLYFIPPQRRAAVLRSTRIINRTFAPRGARVAVNPGIPAGFIAAQTRRPLPTYRVAPHVLAGTQGVAGAVTAQPGRRGRVGPVSVQRTNASIQPQASPTAPQPLSKGQRGQFGGHTPRAVQGASAPNAAPAVVPAPKAPTVAPSAPAAAPKLQKPAVGPQTKFPAPVTPQRRPQTPPHSHVAPQVKPQATPAQVKPRITPPMAKPPVAQPALPKVVHPAAPAVTHPTRPPVRSGRRLPGGGRSATDHGHHPAAPARPHPTRPPVRSGRRLPGGGRSSTDHGHYGGPGNSFNYNGY